MGCGCGKKSFSTPANRSGTTFRQAPSLGEARVIRSTALPPIGGPASAKKMVPARKTV